VIKEKSQTIQPATHCGVKGKIESLDQDIVVLEVRLGVHRILLDREGLSRDDEALWALSQDDSLVS